MFNIILFGPPGSGKGTQAKLLMQKYGTLQISTGDLFRYEFDNDTALGKKAKSFMKRGELVPDAITVEMLRNKVDANMDVAGFIFDGFPRTTNQAEELDRLMKEKDGGIDRLIMLEVPDEEIVKRLLERGKTSGRADDATEEVIRKRIRVYRQETSPVYDYYDEQGLSMKIDGMGDIEEVAERLNAAIDEANV